MKEITKMALRRARLLRNNRMLGIDGLCVCVEPDPFMRSITVALAALALAILSPFFVFAGGGLRVMCSNQGRVEIIQCEPLSVSG